MLKGFASWWRLASRVAAGRATALTNPAPIQHDVAIAKGNQQLVKSELISQRSTSVSADARKYAFYCTVTGHRQAGMEGTLTVK